MKSVYSRLYRPKEAVPGARKDHVLWGNAVENGRPLVWPNCSSRSTTRRARPGPGGPGTSSSWSVLGPAVVRFDPVGRRTLVPRPLWVHAPAAGRGQRVGVLDPRLALGGVIVAIQRPQRLLEPSEDASHGRTLGCAGELGLFQ